MPTPLDYILNGLDSWIEGQRQVAQHNLAVKTQADADAREKQRQADLVAHQNSMLKLQQDQLKLQQDQAKFSNAQTRQQAQLDAEKTAMQTGVLPAGVQPAFPEATTQFTGDVTGDFNSTVLADPKAAIASRQAVAAGDKKIEVDAQKDILTFKHGLDQEILKSNQDFTKEREQIQQEFTRSENEKNRTQSDIHQNKQLEFQRWQTNAQLTTQANIAAMRNLARAGNSQGLKMSDTMRTNLASYVTIAANYEVLDSMLKETVTDPKTGKQLGTVVDYLTANGWPSRTFNRLLHSERSNKMPPKVQETLALMGRVVAGEIKSHYGSAFSGNERDIAANFLSEVDSYPSKEALFKKIETATSYLDNLTRTQVLSLGPENEEKGKLLIQGMRQSALENARSAFIKKDPNLQKNGVPPPSQTDDNGVPSDLFTKDKHGILQPRRK